MIPKNIRQIKSGRLVLTGGLHGVADMFRGKNPPSNLSISKFKKNIETRAARCKQVGVGYRHYVFPDPLTFAAPEMQNPKAWRSYYKTYYGHNAHKDVRYPLSLLEGAPDLQLQTDTHYSHKGYARIAAEIADDLLGYNSEKILSDALSTAKDAEYIGDLGCQCDPEISKTTQHLSRPKGLRYGTNGLEAGNTGILDLLQNDEAVTDKTLLIFGDSFFRGMQSELARYWKRIVFCRTPYMHMRIMDAVAPDHLLTGMAERYLSSVVDDHQAPDFMSMPLVVGRATSPSPGFADLFNELFNQSILEAAPLHTAQVSKAPAKDAQTCEEHMAFEMWMIREGRELKLSGDELSQAWSAAQPAARAEVQKILARLHERGIRLASD